MKMRYFNVYFYVLVLCIAFGRGESVKRRLQVSEKDSRSVNTNQRYQNISQHVLNKRNEDVLVFIAVTSGPHHTHLRHGARSTWTLPCRQSSICDYRFFADAADHKITPELRLENSTYHDMVFRSFCPLMSHHPYYVNYGNAPPIGGNLQRIDDNTSSPTYEQSIPNPDYLYRRLYKIDWKVCFFRYGQMSYPNVQYYVLVEDDSYICTENILHQFQLLYSMTKDSNHVYFRAGTPMYDGFDDSSTMIDAGTAHLFVQHYPSDKLNCIHLEANSSAEFLSRTLFLSWGNSWMSLHCNWLAQLQQSFSLRIHKPYVSCTFATYVRDQKDNSKILLHCLDLPLVLHHSNAHHVVVSHSTKYHPSRFQHVCEYMWLIDKMKDPAQMFDLWNHMTLFPFFHNFTALFSPDIPYDQAWIMVLQGLEKEEQERLSSLPLCQGNRTNVKGEAKTLEEDLFPCLFDLNDTELLSLHKDSHMKTARQRFLLQKQSTGLVYHEQVACYQDFFNNSLLEVQPL